MGKMIYDLIRLDSKHSYPITREVASVVWAQGFFNEGSNRPVSIITPSYFHMRKYLPISVPIGQNRFGMFLTVRQQHTDYLRQGSNSTGDFVQCIGIIENYGIVFILS